MAGRKLNPSAMEKLKDDPEKRKLNWTAVSIPGFFAIGKSVETGQS